MAEIEREHPGLVTGMCELLGVLEDAPGLFGGSALDPRFIERVQRLHGHLDSAGVLLERHRYPSALALVRVGFEHALTDRLLLTATKRRVRYEPTHEDELKHLQAAIASGDPELADITDARQNKKEIVIDRDAQRLMRDGQPTNTFVSPYFEALMFHNSVTGRPMDLPDRVSIHGTPKDQIAAAKRTAKYWEQFLSWKPIVDNLKLNGFYSDRDAGRLQTHYAFLSAFGHPTEYGYNRVDHQGDPCHFCTELAVLYIGTFAAIEIAALLEHCSPRMKPADTQRFRHLVDELHRVSSYLWFPPGDPNIWDRQQVVLAMHMATINESDSSAGVPFGQPMVDPASLTDEEIPYERIVKGYELDNGKTVSLARPN